MSAVVLDGEPDYRDVICLMCERLELRAECVEDVESLLRRAAAQGCRLLIADARPLGGPAGVIRLRERSDAPLLVLDGGGSAESYLEAGADYHLPKPFAPRLLRTTAQAALRRAAAVIPVVGERVEVGRAVFEPARRRLSGRDRRLSLTSREADLLEFFAINAGRVVSRSQIIEGAWGGVAEASDAAVVSAVYRLRRKLADATASASIVAVPGLGYRLHVDTSDSARTPRQATGAGLAGWALSPS